MRHVQQRLFVLLSSETLPRLYCSKYSNPAKSNKRENGIAESDEASRRDACWNPLVCAKENERFSSLPKVEGNFRTRIWTQADHQPWRCKLLLHLLVSSNALYLFFLDCQQPEESRRGSYIAQKVHPNHHRWLSVRQLGAVSFSPSCDSTNRSPNYKFKALGLQNFRSGSGWLAHIHAEPQKAGSWSRDNPTQRQEVETLRKAESSEAHEINSQRCRSSAEWSLREHQRCFLLPEMWFTQRRHRCASSINRELYNRHHARWRQCLAQLVKHATEMALDFVDRSDVGRRKFDPLAPIAAQSLQLSLDQRFHLARNAPSHNKHANFE